MNLPAVDRPMEEASDCDSTCKFNCEVNGVHPDKQSSYFTSVGGCQEKIEDPEKSFYREEIAFSDDESVYISSSSLSTLSEFESSDEKNDDDEKNNYDEKNDDDEKNDNGEKNKPQKKIKPTGMRTKGELGIEDLPKIEELNIKVPEEDMELMGTVSGIVDQLVVVQSFPDSSPLDENSVLFLAGGVPLGKVFETFGPVVKPLYLVRFNTSEDIKKKGIGIGDHVYFTPSREEYTSYVFVEAIRKQKGSDASWTDNNEPPPECIDYSDDEKEKEARLVLKAKRRGIVKSETSKAPGETFFKRQFARKPMVLPKPVPLENNYFRSSFTRASSSASLSHNLWNQRHTSPCPSASVLPYGQPQNRSSQLNFTPAVTANYNVQSPSPVIQQAAFHTPVSVTSCLQPPAFPVPPPYSSLFSIPPPAVTPPPPARLWTSPPPTFAQRIARPPGYVNIPQVLHSPQLCPPSHSGTLHGLQISMPPPLTPRLLMPPTFMMPRGFANSLQPSTPSNTASLNVSSPYQPMPPLFQLQTAPPLWSPSK